MYLPILQNMVSLQLKFSGGRDGNRWGGGKGKGKGRGDGKGDAGAFWFSPFFAQIFPFQPLCGSSLK